MHSDFIREQIVEDIKRGKCFSVSSDEVTDVSNWEQLGVIFRYVKDGVAVEKLVGFVACECARGKTYFVRLNPSLPIVVLTLKYVVTKGVMELVQ